MFRIFKVSALLLFFVCLTGTSLRGQDTASIKIGSIKSTENADTLRVSFKIIQKGVKKHLVGLKQSDFRVTERWGSSQLIHDTAHFYLEDLRQGVIPEDLTIMILGDRTVNESLLYSQFESVKELVKVFEHSKICLSFIDGATVSDYKQIDITDDHWEDNLGSEFNSCEQKGSEGKNLYRAIIDKQNELDTKFQNTDNKILFVFTDGQTITEVEDYLVLDSMQGGEKKIYPTFSVYVGQEGSLDEDIKNRLNALSWSSDNEINGRFYTKLDPDSIRSIMVNAKDSISDDYCLVILNQDGRRYCGEDILLSLELEKDGLIAIGNNKYHLGSNEHNIVVRDNSTSRLFKGIVAGLIMLIVVYLVIQLVIPFFRYRIFLKRYVKPFTTKNSDTVGQSCYYCKEEFLEGDLVVTKCEHIVHKECWDENRNRCPEYGVHKCSKGIHYYNQKQLFDDKNATHFAPWIMYGLIGGLFAWILFNLMYSPNIFAGIIESLALWLRPMEDGLSDFDQLLYRDGLRGFVPKIQSWLLEGILLGFFITLTFSMVLEFRKKNLKILGMILIRSLVGAVCGFLAFLLGGILIIVTNKAASCWYLDWIPWLLFALSTALVLWYKTEIDLKSALIGGGISVLLSFLFLIATNGLYSSLLCYMIYAAGFGVAIAVVHFASEKYFLRIDGSVKERDIAIYKWMSVTGGFNKVSIGSSVDCVLQMNWDDTTNIGERVVELYLENDRPYCHVLDKGVSQQGRTIPKDTVMLLVHGSEFSIGKTRFTYIEKDK